MHSKEKSYGNIPKMKLLKIPVIVFSLSLSLSLSLSPSLPRFLASFSFFPLVLGFELRVYTFCHSTSPFS
jgi:hypothetical protein